MFESIHDTCSSLSPIADALAGAWNGIRDSLFHQFVNNLVCVFLLSLLDSIFLRAARQISEDIGQLIQQPDVMGRGDDKRYLRVSLRI